MACLVTSLVRLICQPDEQDPALVFVGRRSFGGFNAVVEAAYVACARAIASGPAFTSSVADDTDNGPGISDKEMAER